MVSAGICTLSANQAGNANYLAAPMATLGVTSTPVADDKQVCAAAYQGRVACFDLRTGNLNWARDLSSVAGLTMDDSNLYVTDDQGEVIALEKSRGANLWTQDKLRARGTTAPRRVGNYLAVGDGQGYREHELINQADQHEPEKRRPGKDEIEF